MSTGASPSAQNQAHRPRADQASKIAQTDPPTQAANAVLKVVLWTRADHIDWSVFEASTQTPAIHPPIEKIRRACMTLVIEIFTNVAYLSFKRICISVYRRTKMGSPI